MSVLYLFYVRIIYHFYTVLFVVFKIVLKTFESIFLLHFFLQDWLYLNEYIQIPIKYNIMRLRTVIFSYKLTKVSSRFFFIFEEVFLTLIVKIFKENDFFGKEINNFLKKIFLLM